MTPRIRPIAAVCLVLLIMSSSSRSQDRSQTLPMAATAPEGTVVSISSSAAKTGNSNQLPATGNKREPCHLGLRCTSLTNQQ